MSTLITEKPKPPAIAIVIRDVETGKSRSTTVYSTTVQHVFEIVRNALKESSGKVAPKRRGEAEAA